MLVPDARLRPIRERISECKWLFQQLLTCYGITITQHVSKFELAEGKNLHVMGTHWCTWRRLRERPEQDRRASEMGVVLAAHNFRALDSASCVTGVDNELRLPDDASVVVIRVIGND